MKTILILLFSLGSFLALSQTKKIQHKSHSGSKMNLEKGKAYSSKSNFGLPGNQTFYVLDTVKAISATEIQLIYRQSYKCHSPFTKITDLKKEDFERKEVTISNVQGLNNKSTKEDILRIGLVSHTGLWFNNPLEEAVFIGFKK